MFLLRKRGCTYEEIAEALGRSKSSIHYEMTRNAVKGVYTPTKAHHTAYVRRKYARFQGKKIVETPGLKQFVHRALLAGHSPEDIAGRLREGHEKSLPYVSGESIRRYVKSPHGRQLEAELRKRARRKRGKKRTRKNTLDGRTFIDKRPKHINARMRIGHAEFDFINSGKSGTGLLLVVVDRKTRMTYCESIYDVSIPAVERACLSIKERYPEWITGTTDNDILFIHHARLAQLLDIRIFFCHPYHSWEKGSVENANGEIRKDFPKGSDVSAYPPSFFRTIEKRLNDRYMKCLSYQTPSEVHTELKRQKKIRDKRRGSKT
jgi:IS30 family transposase